MSEPTRLSDLATGTSGVVVALPPGSASLTRLREMGLVPGTRFTLVRRAPLGDPIEISLRGSLLSLRASEAALVEVTPS